MSSVEELKPADYHSYLQEPAGNIGCFFCAFVAKAVAKKEKTSS
jgi:hypothetical protein